MVYDLRQSSRSVSKILTGHRHTVNSLRFANNVKPSRESIVPSDRVAEETKKQEQNKSETI